MKKRILPALLALVMVLTMLPLAVFAAEGEEAATGAPEVKIAAAGYAKSQAAAKAQVDAASHDQKGDVAPSTFWIKTENVLPSGGDIGGYIGVVTKKVYDSWNAVMTDASSAALACTALTDYETQYNPENGANFFYFSSETAQWQNLQNLATNNIVADSYTIFVLYYKQSEAETVENGIFFHPENWYEVDRYILNLVEANGDVVAASSASVTITDSTAVEVNDEVMEGLVNSALSNLGDAGEVDTTPVATIKATGDNLTSAAVEVSVVALTNAADSNVSVSLEVADLGSMTLNPAAINAATSGQEGDLSLEVAKVAKDGTLEYPIEGVEVQEAFTASVLDGEGEAVEVTTGEIILTFKTTITDKTKNQIDVYQDGQKVNESIVSFVDGVLTLKVSHLSEFAVALNEEPAKYPVTVEKTGEGTVEVIPVESAESNLVQINAVPADGWQVTSVSVKDASGNTVAVSNTNQFVMPGGSVTVTVVFTQITYGVTVEVNNDSAGSATASSSTPAAGDTVTITATPNAGFVFQGIIVKDAAGATIAGLGGVGVSTFVMPEGAVTVRVIFMASGSVAYEGTGVYGGTIKLSGLTDGKKYVCQMAKADAQGNEVGANAIVVFTASGTTNDIPVLGNPNGYVVSLYAYPGSGSISSVSELIQAFYGVHAQAVAGE